jgi:ADP-ribose pyrophosphatase YjhB (NUDIX family)
MSVHEPAFRFCPACGGPLETRQLKAGDPARLVCARCGFILYLDPKVAVGTVITAADERIVLVRRAIEPGYGLWVFPGGYVDRGESVPDAAVRETKEESQLDVKLGPLLNIYSYSRSPNVIVVYTAQVIGGELAAADESIEARIFPPNEVPWHDLAFDSTKDALNDYIKLYLKS